MDIFKDYCVVYERHKTIPQIRVVPLDKPEDQYVVKVCKSRSIKIRVIYLINSDKKHLVHTRKCHFIKKKI